MIITRALKRARARETLAVARVAEKKMDLIPVVPADPDTLRREAVRDRGVGYPCGPFVDPNEWIFDRTPGPEDGHLPTFVRFGRELRRSDKDEVLGQPLDIRPLNTVGRVSPDWQSCTLTHERPTQFFIGSVLHSE